MMMSRDGVLRGNGGMISLLFAVLVMMVAIAACIPPSRLEKQVILNKTTEVKELTRDDVLDLMDKDLINSSFVSVRGLRLGDTDETVIAKLGRPVSFESLEQGSLNLRFEDPETKETELIVHVEDGKVSRIAIKEGFDDNLVGRSKLNVTKEQATGAFGKPDKVYDTKFYHIFEYHDLGLEIYFKARRMVGYGLVPPK